MFSLTLAVAALGLAACGGDDDEGSDTTAAEPIATDGPDTSTMDTMTDTSTVDTTSDDTMTDDTSAVDTTSDDTTTVDTMSDDTMTNDTMTDGSAGGATADPNADEETFVSYGATELGFPDEEISSCLSQALIDGVGFENVQATGLSPEDFFAAATLAETGVTVDDQVRASIRDGAVECGDLVEAVAEAGLLEEADAQCLRETYTNELVAEQLVVGFAEATESEELVAADAAYETCRGE